ncbi:unnamed protein product [Urochloa decumbens]|uniref:Receptor-like serine/threonine-protein kinase n=1 Tax=Urochloa decumbens TaxID=240449 RepID=A0ABC9FW48_9POAL
MAWSAVVRHAAVILLLLLVQPCASDDRLVPGKPLFPSATIVSNSGSFALGFFSSTNDSSTPAKLYLGIWYNDIPQLTVVWVANRETPITNSTSSQSPPSLSLTNTSNLALSDASGRLLWTTNITGSVVSPSPTPTTADTGITAALLDTGNLVVRSPNGTTLWQSFEHPADTLLPGMKIWIKYSHDEGRLHSEGMASWKAPGDPSPGSFTYGVDPDTFLQVFVWNGTRPVLRSGPWNGFTVDGQYQASSSAYIYVAIVNTGEDTYLSYSLSDGAAHTRYVLTYSGEFQLQTWKNGSSSAWAVLGRWPTWECNRYGHCGPYGYCDSTMAAPTCRCLDGFEPANAEEWSGGVFSRGCRRTAAPRCGDGFLALPGMKALDKFVLVPNRTAGECAAECARNCSCVAYAYADLSSGGAKGGMTRCLVWAGNLIDTEKMGDMAGGETLYLRSAGLDDTGSRSRAKTNALKIVLPTVLVSSIVILAGIILACFKFQARRRIREDHKKHGLILGGTGTSDGLGEGNTAQDFEFPFARFEDIVAATENFSEACKIGQGGFGKVYKAVLSGKEVAIKRLSKDSEQGTKEFRNEVVLIARLQHRNLVRLIGCSVEGDEKMLIYEYLPNKSLDATLFDNSRKMLLDWPTRFNIIKGIARGLLYLHQDSRLTIIHRDLKAANVLLDGEMRPKIADFGMARLFNDNQTKANTHRVVGTYGYMAPEYAMEGVFSIKSDVYSFGVLLVEIVTGIRRSSIDDIMGFPNLIIYAWNMWKEGKTECLADPSIKDTCLADEILLCSQVALLCVQENPDDRPHMLFVVLSLENRSTTLPKPNQPAYFAQRNTEMQQMRDNTCNTVNSLTLTNIEAR